MDANSYMYTKEKEPLYIYIYIYIYIYNSYDAIGAYRQKRINLDSPLWLRWQLDQCIISSREAPIEVHYQSLGTYHEIYKHYLIVRSIKNNLTSNE
jgi:DNA-directed RNA polymerase subunit beta'